MLTDTTSIIALSLVEGAGRAVVRRAIRLAQRAQRPLASLFGLPVAELMRLAAPGEELAAPLIARCGENELARARWVLNWAEERAMRHCTPDQAPYPERLAEALADQTPPVLFYMGNEALFEGPSAAIVGTRHPSLEGVGHARAAARLFSAQGIPVTSGGARGIDEEAHHSALAADGTTIVVAPEGIHSFDATPTMRDGLESGRVLLVSEFLPGAEWQTHRAMTAAGETKCNACAVPIMRASGALQVTVQAPGPPNVARRSRRTPPGASRGESTRRRSRFVR